MNQINNKDIGETVLLYIIKSLGAYVGAIKDKEEDEAMVYYEGIIYGQLQIATALKIITSEDLTNVYVTILDYKCRNLNYME